VLSDVMYARAFVFESPERLGFDGLFLPRR
jgi:hypothetical protein